jgi:nucleoside-diphosphate-sugar epimerase
VEVIVKVIVKVAVTDATGFIGVPLVRALAACARACTPCAARLDGCKLAEDLDSQGTVVST